MSDPVRPYGTRPRIGWRSSCRGRSPEVERPSIGGPPAREIECEARGEAARVRYDELDHHRRLFQRPGALHGNSVGHITDLMLRHRVDQIGPDHRRRERVDGDAGLRIVLRSALHQAYQARLTCVIGYTFGHAYLSGA